MLQVQLTIPERSVAEETCRAGQSGWGWGSDIRRACRVDTQPDQTVGSNRAVANRPPNVVVRDNTCEGVSLCRRQWS